RINATNPEHNAWARLESSAITVAEFAREFEVERRPAGYGIPGQSLLEVLSGDLRPRMVDVLIACKTRYKVACLTNNVKSGTGPGMAATSERAERMARVMALFDLVRDSSK